MTFNGSSVDYDRIFLPHLPTNVKNRSMDASRQAMRTTSEAYGKFLVEDPANVSDRLAANALSPVHDNKHETSNTIAAASR